MTLNISIPSTIENTQPKISVIGVGGAGCNAINTMINSGVSNIDFIVANTDGQALSRSLTKKQIQLGKKLTAGLGAGADHLIGEQAAIESIDEIISELGDINMLFIATGMGGGTGTGASPIIAKAAKEKGILTIAVATKPFEFEGKKRKETAEHGLVKLEESVDTLIVIPNQNLFRIANEQTTFSEAFKLADDVLYQGISGITDLITSPGMINLDFSDIKTVMQNMGKAMMGTGEGSGENRARNAAETALNNPLLDNTSINGASSILLNIKGGPDMTLIEVDEAANLIRNEVEENANIIFGTSVNDELEGVVKVSVVATGLNHIISNSLKKKTLTQNTYNLSTEENKNNETLDSTEELNASNKDHSEQIDIETKIADLSNDQTQDSIKEKYVLEKENFNEPTQSNTIKILEDKKHELSKLIKNKNEVSQNTEEVKQNIFLKSISSLFQNQNKKEKDNGNKIDPSIYSLNPEQIDNNKENEMIEKDTPIMKLSEKDLEDKEENQIDLLDLKKNDEAKLDESVIEIPAFLRRQAN